MNISIVTDEVSSDIETALEIIHSWGVTNVELRSVGGARYPQVDAYWNYRLPQLLDEFVCRVVAISPGLFQTIPPGDSRRPMAFSRRGDMSIAQQEMDAARLRDDHINKL